VNPTDRDPEGGGAAAGASTPGSKSAQGAASRAERADALETRLLAVTLAARFHGTELDREELRYPRGESPPPAALIEWVRNAGLWARAIRLRWSQLMKLEVSSPVVLLLKDGSAALLVTVDLARNVVWLKDPRGLPSEPPVPVDELRLHQVWSGECMLIRAERGDREDDVPFSLGWVWGLVKVEKAILRDVFMASVAQAFLAILPPLMVMTVVNTVLMHKSYSTLSLISLIIALSIIYETLLGYVRRQLTLIVGARVDAKLSLHVFRRLLALPLDFFERNQAGDISYRIRETSRIRDFLSGKMLQLMLDMTTVFVLLPVLFLLEPTLSWMVLVCAGLIALIIVCFLGPVQRAVGLHIQAEIQKANVLIESVHGIRTVKSLALEPQQREAWDRRTADATARKLDAGNMSNWPQTLVEPINFFIQRGILLVGVLMALNGHMGSTGAGGLLAFMMLSGRVAGPLVGLARIMDDFQEVRISVGLAASVLNQAPETRKPGAGLRPRIEGAVSFSKVNYSYPGSKVRALDGITFEIPAGTMLGMVGRSGCGKSTITRLLQGISRDYEGYIRLDGSDLREINLSHLRRNFGVVLQENFLFRGSIRENIIAGRPGLTLSDAVRSARLAGAEEFIERMPNGYETWVEEGSPNLSGGQRQRLAIARALIHDPRLLILDEATSALDPESEALVNANLVRIAQGRTMVIVSHRLASLTDCDQILVLDKGQVMDIGPHMQLVERCPIYRQLWLQQNRHLEPTPRPGAPAPALAQGV
jgi:HlyB family type I secretion system ABC transporter